ncbi:Uncharacterised protein [Bordetella pertussis]|nr:Uncharacterised protein [Bordetella pertussis]
MPLGRRLRDQHAHARRTGERDVVDARVARQGVAGLMAIAGHDIERPGGKAGFCGQFGHAQQRQAGVLGGLDHAGVAGRQRGADAAPEDLQGVVPGHHVAGDAVRLAQRQHGIALLVGDGLAVQLVGRAAVVLEIAGDGDDVGAGLLERLAAIARFERGQLVAVLQHLERERKHEPAAFGGAEAAPGALVGASRSLHRQVDVGGVAARDAVEFLSGGRIDDGNAFTRGSGYRGVVDKVLLHAVPPLKNVGEVLQGNGAQPRGSGKLRTGRTALRRPPARGR